MYTRTHAVGLSAFASIGMEVSPGSACYGTPGDARHLVPHKHDYTLEVGPYFTRDLALERKLRGPWFQFYNEIWIIVFGLVDTFAHAMRPHQFRGIWD